jgi:hypothetical protein
MLCAIARQKREEKTVSVPQEKSAHIVCAQKEKKSGG